ncbi:hypothetical protein CNMCM8980_009980 [Aspergillus fumigatiaffinis]|nr:hypothetical protein CNMCM5878_000148 [Aspergillus fumigatiaffinis]KAF4244733.1 hypothetical protein CNMCM8980_009980 [Aspergillus fumigatiaffinis]
MLEPVPCQCQEVENPPSTPMQMLPKYLPRSKFSAYCESSKSPLGESTTMTTVSEVATLRTSSIYTSDSEMSSCRSSQNLNGLGMYWDSIQMAQTTQASPLVALSLSQESHRAVPVSRNTMEDKPLPPLPRVAFAETDFLDSESELARMSSPGRFSERYPLCVEQRVINVKTEAQSKLEIYPLPHKPGPEHFAALDRAIIRAALRPRPLTIHHERASSLKTNKQEASTLSNAPLCTTGTPTETRSATGAEANHNLPVAKPILDTEPSRKVHFLAPERVRSSARTQQSSAMTNRRGSSKAKSSGVDSLWGSLIQQMNRIVQFSSSRKSRQTSSSNWGRTPSRASTASTQGWSPPPAYTQRRSAAVGFTKLLTAEMAPSLPDRTTSLALSLAPVSASKPTIDTRTRMQRVFSVVVGEPMPPSTIQRLRAEDELLLQGVIQELKATLLGSLSGGSEIKQLFPSHAISESQLSGGPDTSPTLSEESSVAELRLPDSSTTLRIRSVYELETITNTEPCIPGYSTLWKDHGDSCYPQRYDNIILSILRQLDSLDDLFAMATIDRATYRVFKAHEISLIRDCLWKMSPAAWEHCEISDRVYASHTQPGGQNLHVSLYLRHYRQDLRILVQFKTLLLHYCWTVLRKESYSALLDPCSARSKDLDDAIWRVWTFCDLFAAWKERDDDLTGQVSWLQGNPAPQRPL